MRILTIETGIRCNSNCLFCYQRDYRASGVRPRDPDTDDLLERLALGRREGYDGVGFSGGEPTARDDFLRLVQRARELGFQRIALTTNGRRLADPAFRGALLAAGLNGVGWSIHGATAATHDALTGVPGSFADAERGLVASIDEARRAGRRLDVNVFTVVTRRNAAELPALCACFRERGVRLFVLQPLVYARGTLADVAPLALPLGEAVDAVRAALADAPRLGYRVKPFNLPVCLFPGEGTPEARGLEIERHRLRVFRSHERSAPGESRLPTPSGFVRLAPCTGCPLRETCPGVQGSLTPQVALLRELRRALSLRPPGAEAWLGGLELASADTLAAAVAAARGAGADRVVLCTGGTGALGGDLWPALAAARPDAVRFVVHRREPRSGDLRRATRGNLALVRVGLERLAALPEARGVTREVGLLLERSERTAQEAELGALVAAGAQAVHLEVAPRDVEIGERLVDALRLLMGPFRRHPWARAARVTLDLPAPVSALPSWQRRAAAAACDVDDVRDRFVHTVFTGPGFGWLCDSVPPVALPGDHDATDRWPPDVVGPLVLTPAEAPPTAGDAERR